MGLHFKKQCGKIRCILPIAVTESRLCGFFILNTGQSRLISQNIRAGIPPKNGLLEVKTMTETQRIVVNAKMLGKFSLTVGGKRITCQKHRPTLVWLLLEILIYTRRSPLSVEDLIKVLWDHSSSSSDPMNALKNLVYRTRDMLQEAYGDEGARFILFYGDTYCWNPTLEVHTDVDRFSRLCQSITDAKSSTEKIQLSTEAMQLYSGAFLEGTEHSQWAVDTRHQLEDNYAQCIAARCEAMEQQNRTERLPEFCLDALEKAPMNIKLHRLTLFCYLKTERYSEALSHYNDTTSLFFQKEGTDVAPELRDLYRMITKNFRHAQMDISFVREELQETSRIKNAYFCDFEVFRNLYRVEARACLRSHDPATIILMTLAMADGSAPESGSVIREQNVLKSAIISSLRGGDIVTSYSDTQFLILLPQANIKDSEKAIKRIMTSYHKVCRNKDLQVLYKLLPVEAPAKPQDSF